jgi:AraC-like DNA-binding protein
VSFSGPSLRFRLPPPDLSHLISTFYLLDSGTDGIDDWLHPEWANIRIACRGMWQWGPAGQAVAATPTDALFGPTSLAARTVSTPGGALIGIGLLPLGWKMLIGTPIGAMVNRCATLSAVWPELAACAAARDIGERDDARFAALENAVRARLNAFERADESRDIRMHETLVHGDIQTVAAFAQACGLSERTLARHSERSFGFGPKLLLRRQRFLRSLDRMLRQTGPTLTDMQGDEFADQSHFSREFRAFMGMTPRDYLALPRPLLRLAARERLRLAGQSLQGLHPPVPLAMAAE